MQGGEAGYEVGKENADGSMRSANERIAKAKQQHAGGVVGSRMLDDDVRRAVADRTQKQLDARLYALVDAGAMSFSDAAAKRTVLLQEDFYKTNWNSLARVMDAKVQGTAVERKRKFSGTVCTSAKTRGSMSIMDLVAGLKSAGLFQAGRGALITGGVDGGAHAVAAHVRKLDDLYLFDPNYGIFKCPNPPSLGRAIVTLISQIWVTLEKWTLDGEYGYAIFEARSDTGATKPGQVDVSFRHGDQATFLANKASLRLK